MNTRRIVVSIVAILAIAVAAPALTQSQEERYSGLAQHLGSGPSGQTEIEIVISRWSSVEEAQKLVDVLAKEGHKEVLRCPVQKPRDQFSPLPRRQHPVPERSPALCSPVPGRRQADDRSGHQPTDRIPRGCSRR